MNHVSKPILGAGLALILAPAATAQVPSARPVGDLDVLNSINVAEATVQTLQLPASPGSPFSVDLLVDGTPVELNLWPQSIFAEDYRLMAQQPDGSYLSVDPGPVTTYKGSAVGYPESSIAASLLDGQLTAMLRLTEASSWFAVQPLDDFDATASFASHVVYDSTDNLPENFTCGTPDGKIDQGGFGGLPVSASGADGGSSKVVQVACDADFEYYQANGSSVTQTQNDIANIMNAVETIYKNETIVDDHEITVIYVETSEPDPYSTTSSSSLLSQFRNHWNSSHNGDVRDVAHLFTGKNLAGSTIGVAYLNQVCNLSQAYGLSQSKYTGNFTNRVGLTAHEIGHNWGANHCDGQSDCRIMCSCLGCCGPVTTFGTSATNAINNKANSGNCIGDAPPPAPPVIVSIVPNTVSAFGGGFVTINGLNLTGADTVTLGSTVLSAPLGFAVLDDTSISVLAPVPTVLGPVNVSVSNSLGTSNTLTMTYVETDPPTIGTAGIITSLPYTWSYGGGVNDLYFTYVALNDNSTFQLLGQNWLSASFLLWTGTLDSVGTASDSFSPIPASLVGTTIYSQFAEVDDQTSTITASNIAQTTILF